MDYTYYVLNHFTVYFLLMHAEIRTNKRTDQTITIGATLDVFTTYLKRNYIVYQILSLMFKVFKNLKL